MNKEVRTTLIYGLLSALAIAPVLWFYPYGKSLGLLVKIVIWADLGIYALMLCRWSRTSIVSIAFPLILLLGIALWPYTHTGFIVAAICIFSWIRSGICYTGAPVRNVTAELITLLGGAALVVFWRPGSPVAWALGIWLFFLAQSLYFYFPATDSLAKAKETGGDPFDQAKRELERVLEDTLTG